MVMINLFARRLRYGVSVDTFVVGDRLRRVRNLLQNVARQRQQVVFDAAVKLQAAVEKIGRSEVCQRRELTIELIHFFPEELREGHVLDAFDRRLEQPPLEQPRVVRERPIVEPRSVRKLRLLELFPSVVAVRRRHLQQEVERLRNFGELLVDEPRRLH